jgi:hypothetical protein
MLILILPLNIIAQSSPVLYFCEYYDSRKGEIGVSDKFTTGSITVVVKSNNALGLNNVSIQFDKWDKKKGRFEYYKSFYFTVEPEMNYIYFERNKESDMSFDRPGLYRVFLLDERERAIVSSLVEIVK